MKLRIILIAFFLFIISPNLFSQERKESGNLVMEDMPEIPQRIIERMNQYQNVRAASFLDWEPTGKGMLVSTRFGETNQIHFLEQPKGARQQITFFKEPAGGGAFSPKKETRQFVFSMDNGGGEFFQLYSFDMRTGKYQLITDGKSRNTGFLWNNSGTQVAFSSTKRNGKDTDIYTMNPDDPASAKLTLEVSGSWGVLDWSPDDKKLIVQQ